MQADKEKTKKAKHAPELKVVFDTSILYTGSASDLVRHEIEELLKKTPYTDLEITWYLADVVRYEREHQMLEAAKELLPPIEKLERLLGHNLNITKEIVSKRVQEAVAQKQTELGFTQLPVDKSKVDWDQLMVDAVFRRPPFESGTERGFRDALLLESFVQLVEDSPKTPQVCRLALVTGDNALAEAASTRTGSAVNVRILKSVEELKGLINTLVSEVEEAFIAKYRSKAREVFFIPQDENTLLYKERIQQQILEKFRDVLEALPAGASSQKKVAFKVGPPNFVRKKRQRIYWSSRIIVETEAFKTVRLEPGFATGSVGQIQPGPPFIVGSPLELGITTAGGWKPDFGLISGSPISSDPTLRNLVGKAWETTTVRTNTGAHIFEAIWSVSITVAEQLKKPKIEEIKYIDTTWQPV